MARSARAIQSASGRHEPGHSDDRDAGGHGAYMVTAVTVRYNSPRLQRPSSHGNGAITSARCRPPHGHGTIMATALSWSRRP